jgi:Spy/CpxP family protein refolding chaperone
MHLVDVSPATGVGIVLLKEFMMNAYPTIHRYRLLTGSLLVIVPFLAFAGPPMGSAPGNDGSGERRLDGCSGPDGHGFGDFGSHEHGWGWSPHPAFLEGLKLTEEQEDKVFAILHAAAPALREQAKAAGNAHEGFRELGMSAQYDDARAKALTDAAGKAESQIALLHIRAEHEIYSILTAEQRAQLVDRRHNWGPHEHDGHGPNP